ncbi:N-6 DNA methylase [Acidobacteriota bacterium]
MTQQELEKYLWGAATYLRGTIDAGDYKQYIFPLLFFKRISDVYDEEYELALKESNGDLEYAAFEENHRFQIPDGAHWKDVREVTVNVGIAIQAAARAIEKANPDTLYGIFGDSSWTNKDRLSDEILTNLIEHFSKHSLNNTNVPSDQLGDAYEYLIKQFADDSGHTAAEFYTNRTVVRLMTLIMDPQPGESVYDPTCGSGGLLLNCALQLKVAGKEYRTLKLYGQEINLITSAIARMNMFMHGIEEFDIIRDDTLANPGFIEYDELKKFNMILANPPYSIKRWDQKSFENDPYGRNMWGTPPPGRADYAFQQHIHNSMNEENGRCAILWPHGILFRDAEMEMRKRLIKTDTVEAVIGLGANLFYNSPMEAMILVCNTNKPDERKNKVLFIDGINDVVNEKGNAYLTEDHIQKLYGAYKKYSDIPGFAKIVTIDEIMQNNGNMNISFYVKRNNEKSTMSFNKIYDEWKTSSDNLSKSMNELFEMVK